MKTPPADLYAAAATLLPRAYAPYSHFSVAASLRTQEGVIFSGCNVENASFSLTVCAETNAISTMIAQGHTIITEALVLVADKKLCAPCGACRQRLLEHAAPDALVHLCTTDGQHETITVQALLPLSFGPHNLGK